MKEKKGKFKIVLIIILLLMCVCFAVLGYLIKEDKIKFNSENSSKNQNESSNFSVGNNSKKSKRIYIYKDKNDVSERLLSTEKEVDTKKYDIVYTYTCDNCNISSISDKPGSVLLVENNEIYLFDYSLEEKKKLNIIYDSKYVYGYIEYLNEVNNIIISFWDDKYSEEKHIYYSLDYNEKLFDSTAHDIYFNELDDSVMFEDCIMRNIKTGDIINSFNSANDGCMIKIIEKNGKRYYQESNNMFEEIVLYNENYKKLINTFDSTMLSILKNGNVSVFDSDNRYYNIYDINGNFVLKSRKFDEVLLLTEEYVAVLDEGYLKIFDYDGKEVANFVKWDQKWEFHEALSGYYTTEGKYGLYLVVEERKREDDEGGFGKEYYYLFNTGETGYIESEIGAYAKPILYLYPKKNTNVTIKFEKPNLLTTTYPKYENNWEVLAKPTGDLTDMNGKYYYGLYWEEEGTIKVDFNEGFYVTKENAIEFLEEKLKTIGLNEKEKNEFIMYWLPILEKNKKSLVYFELTESREAFNRLLINPKPDSLLRMAIHIKKIDKKINIREQKLLTFKRTGFTAVEWGGVIHN